MDITQEQWDAIAAYQRRVVLIQALIAEVERDIEFYDYDMISDLMAIRKRFDDAFEPYREVKTS